MEREVGGGIGMGNTCKPMAVSFQCMTKFTTNKKEKKFYNNKNIYIYIPGFYSTFEVHSIWAVLRCGIEMKKPWLVWHKHSEKKKLR